MRQDGSSFAWHQPCSNQNPMSLPCTIDPCPLASLYVPGVVSTTLDYDIDAGSNMGKMPTLTVTVSDRQLLTGTATLTIRFIDCNDNAPVFPVSVTLVFS